MSFNDDARALEGRFDVDPGIRHHFHPDGGNGYAKQMRLPAGYAALSHSHPTDHISVLAAGRVIVETDEHPPREVIGPDVVFIRAHLSHSIRALEDSVWFCVHDIVVDDHDSVDDVILQRV